MSKGKINSNLVVDSSFKTEIETFSKTHGLDFQTFGRISLSVGFRLMQHVYGNMKVDIKAILKELENEIH